MFITVHPGDVRKVAAESRSAYLKLRWNVELTNSVIMDVMNVEQAKIAEEAGASAVMALGKLPGAKDPT